MDAIISHKLDLSTAWLAANYDKKLLKQQIISTSVSELSNAISKDKIPLRYSGTLLLGVTKIYSKQTKYCLDIAADIELKSRFRPALKRVDLTGDTIISSRQLLKDQISKFDLLYQPELDLGDLLGTNSEISGNFGFTNNALSTDLYDTSIEMGRGLEDEIDNDLQQFLDHPEIEIDLFGNDDNNDYNDDNNNNDYHDDIDLFNDIEVGRDADENVDFDIDLGQPLELIEEPTEEPQVQKQPVKRTGITADGELITNKRKLKIDAVIDLPISELRDNQSNIILNTGETLTLQQKLNIIYSEGINNVFKKRKTGLSMDVIPFQVPSPQSEDYNADNSFDNSMDNNDFEVDFDLSLPDISPPSPPQEIDEFVTPSQDNVKSTKQVADELKELFKEDTVTTLSSLIRSDLRISESNEDSAASQNKNPKKHAAKCFFELLVLATSDCIELNQTESLNKIGNEIKISGRGKLYSF